MRPTKQLRLSLQAAVGMGNAFGEDDWSGGDAAQPLVSSARRPANTRADEPCAQSDAPIKGSDAALKLSARVALDCGQCVTLMHQLHQHSAVCFVPSSPPSLSPHADCA